MTGFNIFIDGILISTSFAACFYCILLSRRVRRLASADQGVGKGIADMTEAVERLNASLEQTRLAARTESDQLQRRLAEARSLSERAAEQQDESEQLLADVANRLSDARQMVQSLESLVEAANKRRQRARRAEERETWRPDLSDGLPAEEAHKAAPPLPRRPSPSAAGDDDDALLLDAMALDQSEDDGDPLPDVMPIMRRRNRHAGPAVRNGSALRKGA
ncbi:MAG: hypothetical protein KDC18_09255 [Alphaproteobacteria bacterium]|nr:hypothetical protein [Alphaproteobacteria bacterium]MCB9928762.1 hypothetical protein [Alphaproteobacteria bacterium]